MKFFTKSGLLYIFILLVLFSCRHEEAAVRKYFTKNIVVVIMDGARYSETYGDPSFINIPFLHDSLSMLGVVNTNFMNNGVTSTVAGHTAITTGNYQIIDNSGAENPYNPSFFQNYHASLSTRSKSWIITSKGKLAVLGNCQHPLFINKSLPEINCGIDGLGNGYREDSLSLEVFLDVMKNERPSLVLLNFREPDYSAHTGDTAAYFNGIRKTDKYIYQIWKYLQEDPFYKNRTTMFVTNDHGRHLDTVSVGFSSHGDGCEGCRHVMFYAYGPDFKQNVVVNNPRDLIDISATIAELLQFKMPYGKGQVMMELFK